MELLAVYTDVLDPAMMALLHALDLRVVYAMSKQICMLAATAAATGDESYSILTLGRMCCLVALHCLVHTWMVMPCLVPPPVSTCCGASCNRENSQQ
jgi:hypothetical protein